MIPTMLFCLALAEPPVDPPLPAGAIHRFGDVRWLYPEGIGMDALAATADGKLIAVAGHKNIAVFDTKTGLPIHTFPALSKGQTHSARVALSPDGERIAYLTEEQGDVIVRELADGDPIRIRGPFTGVEFGSDGKAVYCFGEGRIIRADPRTGRTLRVVRTEGRPHGLSRDGKRFWSWTSEREPLTTVLIAEAETGKVLGHISTPFNAYWPRAALSPDGGRVAVSDGESQVWIWEVATGEQVAKLMVADDHVISLRFSPDGSEVLAGTSKGSVARFDLKRDRLKPPLTGTQGMANLTFTGDGTQLIASAMYGIHRWRWPSGEELSSPSGYPGTTRIAVSPDGRTVAVGTKAGRVDLWDADTGRKLRELRAEDADVTGLAFSPRGDRLAVGLYGGVVEIRDRTSWDLIATLGERSANTAAMGLTFSPDGTRLLAREFGKEVAVWRIAGSRRLWVYPFPMGQEGVSALSPDGKVVAVGGREAKLRFLDADTGEQFAAGDIGVGDDDIGDSLRSVAFSPDGKTAVTAQFDRNVVLWDVRTGKRLRVSSGEKGEQVLAAKFSPDGAFLATVWLDGTLRIRETLTGREGHRIVSRPGWTPEFEFSPDGTKILTAAGPEVILWSLKPR